MFHFINENVLYPCLESLEGKGNISRIIVLAAFLVVLPQPEAYTDTATQTDLSGGDGVLGSVIDWSNECYCKLMNIALLRTMLQSPLEHTIDGDFDGARSVYSADINGDGCMDVIGAAYSADEISWWENLDGSATSWTKHTVDGDFFRASSVFSADVNGDGYMDILGAAFGRITWWENADGSGTIWTEHTVSSNFGDAVSVYSADVNGDGCMDVLGADTYGYITWWENMDGSGARWTERIIQEYFGEGCSAYSVYSADVNSDGCMDVLGAAMCDGLITWWENVDGSGTSWTGHTVSGNFSYAESVYSADVNGDGCMDVLGAGSSCITWWENMDGMGTSWTEHTVDGDFDGARSVHSADINGDGYMDVLGAALQADEISWWDLTTMLSE